VVLTIAEFVVGAVICEGPTGSVAARPIAREKTVMIRNSLSFHWKTGFIGRRFALSLLMMSEASPYSRKFCLL
jgi:hypothetical protein